jgi:hypothetical protein
LHKQLKAAAADEERDTRRVGGAMVEGKSALILR